MEKEYKAHPFEFFHGEAIRQFHLYRSKNNLEANFKIDGIIFNEIIVAAKNETKKKYPEEIELSSIGGEEKTLPTDEVSILVSQMNAAMIEQYQRHDYRSMYEIWEMIVAKSNHTKLAVPSKKGEPNTEEINFQGILKAKREYYGDTEAAIEFAAEEYLRQTIMNMKE